MKMPTAHSPIIGKVTSLKPEIPGFVTSSRMETNSNYWLSNVKKRKTSVVVNKLVQRKYEIQLYTLLPRSSFLLIIFLLLFSILLCMRNEKSQGLFLHFSLKQ